MSRFVPNRRFAAEVERSLAFQAAMRAAAEHVRDRAELYGKQIGLPWLPRKGAESSFVVAQQAGKTAVVLTDHGGHWAEWGNVNVPPAAPLRRAARSVGLHLK